MTTYEKKVDAIVGILLSDNLEDKQNYLRNLRDLDKTTSEPEAPRDMESTVRERLLEIGVPDSLTGHPYLVRAIEIVANDRSQIKAIMKGLYPDLAEAFGTTPSRVERAIRHAIEVAWDRGGQDALIKYFGNTISQYKGKPTNSEFIARMANVVRQRMQ